MRFLVLLSLILTSQVAAQTQPRSSGPPWCSANNLNPTEISICTDAELTELDLELNAVHADAEQKSLTYDAGTWLRGTRDSCGQDKQCIAFAIIYRIEDLKERLALVSERQESRSSQFVSDDGPVRALQRWNYAIDVGDPQLRSAALCTRARIAQQLSEEFADQAVRQGAGNVGYDLAARIFDYSRLNYEVSDMSPDGRGAIVKATGAIGVWSEWRDFEGHQAGLGFSSQAMVLEESGSWCFVTYMPLRR